MNKRFVEFFCVAQEYALKMLVTTSDDERASVFICAIYMGRCATVLERAAKIRNVMNDVSAYKLDCTGRACDSNSLAGMIFPFRSRALINLGHGSKVLLLKLDRRSFMIVGVIAVRKVGVTNK